MEKKIITSMGINSFGKIRMLEENKFCLSMPAKGVEWFCKNLQAQVAAGEAYPKAFFVSKEKALEHVEYKRSGKSSEKIAAPLDMLEKIANDMTEADYFLCIGGSSYEKK